MEDILLGGEKELMELKKTLQEKERYNSVLDSLDVAVKEQRDKIEQRKNEIELEMNAEIKRRREEAAKPYYDEIAVCEVDIQKARDERARKRQELIDQLIREETEMYEKRKKNLEKQIKLVGQEEGVPAVCTSRLFLAFFCPRTGKDALILIAGLVLLLLVLPMALYFGAYGGNDRQALTTIYLVLIVFFYTLYLLINNLVKDKYLVGINKLLNLFGEMEKLEAHRKQRLKELENIPDSSLDLQEFDEEIGRLEAVVGELTEQKNLALMNFDSDERMQLDIGKQVQEKYRSEMDQMRAGLDEALGSYNKMQKEYDKFLNEKNMEDRYGNLLRIESGAFNQKVIDELIFFICHAGADNIRAAVTMRKRKAGDPSAF
ncbi:MAG: hypothetical protein J6K04_02315 [Lachnospiraceae bacterium]|nr:hypothetical protein [Lachnospiraceae bacterium]